MSTPHLSQLRLKCAAFRHLSEIAPSVKPAAGGHRDRAGQVAGEDRCGSLGVATNARNGCKQSASVRVQGLVDEALRRTHFHDLTQVHDGDAAADVRHNADVMRDEDRREVKPLLQSAQDLEDLCLDRDVERRDGLIGDDQLRLARERPRNPDALSLAPAELMGEATCLGGIESDELQKLTHTLDDRALPAEASQSQREADDLLDSLVRV